MILRIKNWGNLGGLVYLKIWVQFFFQNQIFTTFEHRERKKCSKANCNRWFTSKLTNLQLSFLGLAFCFEKIISDLYCHHIANVINNLAHMLYENNNNRWFSLCHVDGFWCNGRSIHVVDPSFCIDGDLNDGITQNLQVLGK